LAVLDILQKFTLRIYSRLHNIELSTNFCNALNEKNQRPEASDERDIILYKTTNKTPVCPAVLWGAVHVLSYLHDCSLKIFRCI